MVFQDLISLQLNPEAWGDPRSAAEGISMVLPAASSTAAPPGNRVECFIHVPAAFMGQNVGLLKGPEKMVVLRSLS
jgi:hypothetical protein